MGRSAKNKAKNSSNGEKKQKYSEEHKRLIVVTLCALLLVLGTLGGEVANKRIAIVAGEYAMSGVVLMSVVGVLGYVTIVYVAVRIGAVGMESACGKSGDRHVWYRPPVDWWKPATTGLLFVLHDMLLKIGGRGAVPGVLILVLMKLTIPCSMLLSSRMLKLSYQWNHFLAVGLLLLGALACVWEQLAGASWGGPGEASWQILLITLSVIPLALSFVQLEIWLKEEEVFAVAYWAWTCIFMSVVALIMVPVGALLSGDSQRVYAKLWDGILCYTTGGVSNSDDLMHSEACSEAHGFWLLAMIFTFMSNIAMPLCTRYGSATFLWVTRALCTPLAGVLFASPLVMGKYAAPDRAPTQMGIFLVTIGVFVFDSQPPKKPQLLQPAEAEKPLLEPP